MYHSRTNATKLQELRTFLSNVSKSIITSEDVQQKTFRIRQNFIPAYTLVYDMCNQKPSMEQKMLQEYKNSLTYFIQSFIDQTQQQNPFRFALQNSRRVIGWFNDLWFRFVKFTICISKKVFAYLDRHYLPGTDEGSLHKVGKRLFMKNVCHEHNLKFFESCFIKEIREMRGKKLIDSSELLKFSDAFSAISYKELSTQLTSRFIDQTISYYHHVYAQNSSLPSIQYFSKIYNTLRFEEVLIKMSISLYPQEISRVFEEFSKTLVQNFTQTFCGAQSSTHGLRKMFQQQDVEFMKVVYEVYRRFEGFDKIKEAYYEFLLEQGEEVLSKFNKLQGNEQSLPIIDQIYAFYKSHLAALTSGFIKRNELFVTLNNAIEKIISRQQHFSRILYHYCSQCRKQSTFETNKDKITLLFQKILSKDEFVSLYEAQLFKKIANNEVDLNKEEQFVMYLNEICGSQVTFKLAKKIKDVHEVPKSKELVKELPLSVDFNVSVLSLHLWEKKFIDQISLNIALPHDLDIIWRGIQRNFTQIQPKKKLIPLPFENKLTLEVKFNRKPYLIKCNLIQAAVFTFLASKSYTSQEDLIINLRLQKTLVQSTMEAFESIPHLLLKTTLGDFIVNWYFDHPQQTIDLVSKTQESNKQMEKAIKQDREILVQAAIVKFVKRAKHATFEETVEGVVKGIRLFKPLPQVIKAAVDKLVKKGFIEETEGGVLEYVE